MKKDHGLLDSRAARLDSDGGKPPRFAVLATNLPGQHLGGTPAGPCWMNIIPTKGFIQDMCMFADMFARGSVVHRNDSGAQQQPLKNWTGPRKRGQPYPGLHPLQHGQHSDGGDCAPLPCSAETPREPCVQLWSPQHRTDWELWERGQRRPQQ